MAVTGRWGCVAFAIVTLLGFVGGIAFDRFKLNDRPIAEVRLDGADLTGAGAVTSVIASKRLSLEQRCNGACDDLTYGFQPQEAEYRVEVKNAGGDCVVCSQRYVDTYDMKDRVEGADKLEFHMDLVKR